MDKPKYFTVAAYCPPQPAQNGYATEITDKQYALMKELGVDVAYGHNEYIGGESEEEAFSALKFAAAHGIKYLVRDGIYERFTRLDGKGVKPFKQLSEREKEELSADYEKSLSRYKDLDGFGGVSFIDEPGAEMFDGIAFAKSIFDKVCPGKLFYVNLLPYFCLKKQYQYALQFTEDSPLDPHFDAEPKECRYAYYVKSFLDKVKPQVLSYDIYPFLTLGEETTMVHKGLYDHLEINGALARKAGVPLWAFVQGGGKWEGSLSVRIPTAAEIALQINVGTAYGVQGVEIFPYAFPRDWDNDETVVAGCIDRDGNPTPIYDAFKSAIGFLRRAEPHFIGAKYLLTTAFGDYNNDLGDYADRLNIPDCDCIFDGKIAPRCVPHLAEARADSQVVVGAFEKADATLYYVANNSTRRTTGVKLRFDAASDTTLNERGGIFSLGKTDALSFTLSAGGAALVVKKK